MFIPFYVSLITWKWKSNYFYSILEVFHKVLWKIKNRVMCPLKWTYFCNRHMGAISHWEKCRQNNIINSIVSSFIARFVSMSAITNYFLPNLWKCRYHVYWNLSYRLSILKVIFSKSHNFDQRNQGPVVLWRN
jgi:hypothetical protein